VSPRVDPLPRRLGVARYFDGTRLHPGDVEITGNTVSRVGLPPGPDGLAAPGWIDLQVNGFAGVDVLHAGEAELRAMATRLAATGVTAALPTVITATCADTAAAVGAIDAVCRAPEPNASRFLGAHLEGPFLSSAFPGAHPTPLLRTSSTALLELTALPGVAMTTLAPELFDDATITAAAASCVVSIGHSDGTATRSREAFAAGAGALTHAFNAHRPIRSRDAGPLGAALTSPHAVLTVIADGIHVATENLTVLHRAAPGRLALITDCTVATGLPNGDYSFGDLSVTVADDRAMLSDGTLAGSVATLDHCVRVAAATWGLEVALAAASRIPAELLGRYDLGQLGAGSIADLVCLDDDLRVVETIIDGNTAWARHKEKLPACR